MPETPAADYVLTASGENLRVCCVWVGDRFAHRLEGFWNQAWQPWLESVEGDTENPWPPSAPIQELHRQDWMESDCLLGVGKAGHGHWSLSLEPLNDAVGFRFDMACRAKLSDATASLAQTYQGVGPKNHAAIIKNESPTVMTIHPPGVTRGHLEWRVVEGGQLRSLSESKCALEVDLPKESGPHTVRWIYELRWISSSESS